MGNREGDMRNKFRNKNKLQNLIKNSSSAKKSGWSFISILPYITREMSG